MGNFFLILRIVGVVLFASAFLCKYIYSALSWTFIFFEKNDNSKKRDSIKKFFYIQVLLGLLGIILIIVGSIPAII